MRRVLATFVMAAVLVLASVGTTLASPALGAAPKTTVSHRGGLEYLPMSAAECTFMRKAFPAQTGNPKVCELEHGWTETIIQPIAPTAAAGDIVAATSCPNETHHFHDWIVDALHAFWQADLDTTFQWTGNCGYPNLTILNPYIEWANDTTFSGNKSYSYHYYSGSGWVSTAAVYTVYPTPSIGGQTFFTTDFQRRECYSNNGDGSCNWTSWEGA